SELVTAAALRNSLPDFLAQQRDTAIFKKFMRERIEPTNCAQLRLAGYPRSRYSQVTLYEWF
ncbi:MAG: hypothetical protein JWO52_6135, partial [Gammaproteobacteria bacterium]|nr:hypothetical protein [Gammaproteobacteria bacterium]